MAINIERSGFYTAPFYEERVNDTAAQRMLLGIPAPHQPVGDSRPIVRNEAVVSTPRPDFAGRRLHAPGRRAIYLVDPAGYRRRVPNDFVYRRLFGNGLDVADCVQIERIALGPPLAAGTMLVRGHAAESVYLVDIGRRRRVASDTVMRKYGFAFDWVFAVRQVLVDSIPPGADWE
jgi:hypothetical protein